MLLIKMEDSEPQDLKILTDSLPELETNYCYLLNSTEKFMSKSLLISSKNKSEYNIVYQNLWGFYEKIINSEKRNIENLPINIYLKAHNQKKFASQNKRHIQGLLISLDKLSHPNEESLFYNG